MKNQLERKKILKYPEILISVAVLLLMLLVSRIGIIDNLELRAYDLLLGMKPPTAERDDIVIVAIDDASIGEVGTFPWPRDVLADAIIRLRELGAKQVSFDIEYLSPSSKGINTTAEAQLPNVFYEAKDSVEKTFQDIAEAVNSGGLPIEYLGPVLQEAVVDYVLPELSYIESDFIPNELFRDNDEYFAQALHYFGNSWLTINAGDVGIELEEGLEEYVRENMLLNDVTEPEGLTEKENKVFLEKEGRTRKMTPALFELIKSSNGAGFTNIILDSDGTRRRVELLHESEGQYIPQLVFAPLLYTLDTDKLVRTQRQLTVKNALFPGETERRDIKIPLDEDGRMLVNWIPDTFRESFKNESTLFLYDIDQLESTLIYLLEIIARFQIGSSEGLLDYYAVANYLLDSYNSLQQMKQVLLTDYSVKNTRQDPRFDEYFSLRETFFSEAAELTNPIYLEEILLTLDMHVSEETKSDFEAYKVDIKDKFTKYSEYLLLYNERFEELHTYLEGTFCVVGHTASNSTDLGTTPFEGQYPNVGTHANVYNTIMSESFITPIPRYYYMILVILLAFVFAIYCRRASTTGRNIVGFILVLIFPILAIILIQFSYYAYFLAATFSMILCYLGISFFHFAVSERDKSFLRHAFSTYLSEDVVKEIVDDPSKLALGGEEKHITAIFTDIKSFSTLSEQVTPEQLVAILNEYLTLLSNVILEYKGTIDKYIGDAIVGFYGAPMQLKDHAWYACLSAIRMKEAEKALNERLLAEGLLPMPIHTRIGLNTGNMVVGNMGTDMKMNYTMMGNDVNLAARLEGVNKSYESWILVSESTWNEANSGEHEGKLLARRLDKVRVVGIDTPVQLYNLLGVKEEMTEDCIKSVAVFHEALDLYLDKQFEKAKEVFKLVSKLAPEDETAKIFEHRCSDFIQKGVPAGWNGIVKMTTK